MAEPPGCSIGSKSRLTAHAPSESELVDGSGRRHSDLCRVVTLARMRRANDLLERVTGRRLMPRPGPPPDPLFNIEPEAKAILDTVRGWTMAVPLQQWATWSATRYIEINAIPGAIVEFGVWRGGMCQIAARTLLAHGSTNRDIFLFDTFAGMTPPTAADYDVGTGRNAAGLLAAGSVFGTHGVPFTLECIADVADVRSGMAATGYPMDRVHLIRGDVAETIPEQLPDVIAFARLDTDWYESTRHELAHVWKRIAPGGVMAVDDYDAWAGSRRATDEWWGSLPFKPLPMRPGSGRLYVKPG
jgi:O-methyltransferase